MNNGMQSTQQMTGIQVPTSMLYKDVIKIFMGNCQTGMIFTQMNITRGNTHYSQRETKEDKILTTYLKKAANDYTMRQQASVHIQTTGCTRKVFLEIFLTARRDFMGKTEKGKKKSLHTTALLTQTEERLKIKDTRYRKTK